MAGLLSGGAVGTVMGELLKAAIETINKGREFKPTLETNIDTLNSLAPLVQEMKRYNQQLGRPREEIERLEREIQAGEELARKCSKLGPWKFLCFPYYRGKLKSKDESLKRNLSVNVQAQNARNMMEVMANVGKILEILNSKENFGQCHECQIRGISGAPVVPQCMGMDEPLNKLKGELLKDGVSVNELTGLGGSGKSTLATKLCCDPQIKVDEHHAKVQLEEDGQLARTIQESLNIGPPPHYDNDSLCQLFRNLISPGHRICTGCNTEIGQGSILSHNGAIWHPGCFCCHACNLPITDYKVQKVRYLMEVILGNNLYSKENFWQCHGCQIRGISGAPVEPQCMGMDEPLNKLKGELLKDGVSVNELTGLGGSGKSTLAKKLCWDPQIKVDEHHAKVQLEEDGQLARTIQESLNIGPPPHYDNDSLCKPFLNLIPPGHRICAGCNTEIGYGRYLSRMGAIWHPVCFCCHACNLPITDYEFSISSNHPYHKSCNREQHHPRCDVCKNFIPTNSAGLVEYRAHPFWLQKYCPSHGRDGTPRCCSCERMEPKDTKYLLLDDGRKLCLECLDSAIMDTHKCQPLYLQIQEFYEGLNLKVEQQIPMFLVERQVLNEAVVGEKNGHHHLTETRGLCFSEEQTFTAIIRRPSIMAGYRRGDMITEPYRLTRRCEVTTILVLYGFTRLLTGSILAHEMMHAWLGLNGYPNMSPEVEEGICQVLAHMWLDSEMYSGFGNEGASSSSSSLSSSLHSSSSSSSKKGKWSDFEKKLGEFFKHQIESDTSSVYGDGFRLGKQAVLKYGLKRTLDHIQMTGSFP